ncbi:MAG: hypothetical protein GX811_03635, partial [Lentisphaerae bacterium]|nr:hypothetical protein [Lentisphaerota bacterium]
MFDKLTKLALFTLFLSFVAVLNATESKTLTEQMNELIKNKKNAEAKEIANKIIAMPDATPEQKFSAYNHLFQQNKGGWDIGTPQQYAYYMDLKPEEECNIMKTNALHYLTQMSAIKPQDPDTCINYGEYLIYLNRAKEAFPILESGLKAENLTPDQKAMLYLQLAEASLALGDKEKSIKYLEELHCLNVSETRFRGEPAGIGTLALNWLRGVDLDKLQLPQETGAKLFPIPQNAKYSDKFVQPSSVRVTGVPANDARVKLLKQKLERFGIKFENSAKFVISINENKLKAPERNEGYAITVTDTGATLQGYDTLGTTWAVVSLIQLVDQPTKRIRICEVEDWPETPQRGHSGSNYDAIEVALFSKMNFVANQFAPTMTHGQTPLRMFASLEPARILKEFGLYYYIGDRTLNMYPKYPFSSERTFELNLDWMMKVAAEGGNCLMLLDDGRYPLHPNDIELNKNAASQDAKFVSRLFRTVKEKHPEFRLIYCPPFYWGPYMSKVFISYESVPGGDKRDDYNRSIAEELDPGIDVFWTGERMVSYDIEKRDTDWAKEAFGRKPFVSQNRPLPHQHHYGAIVDAIPWAEWQYDEFGDDVAGYMANQSSPARAVALAAMNEAMWNRKRFDRYDTVKRATAIFFGPGMYEILEPGSKAFYQIDTFMRADQFTPYMLKNIDEYEQLVKIARDAYDKAMAKDPERMKIFGGTGAYSYDVCLSIVEKHLKVAKSAEPDYFQTKYAKNIEVIRELAKKETGLNEEKGDLLITASEIFGGEWANFRKPSTAFDVVLRGVLHQPRVNLLEFEFDSAESQAHELLLYGQ